MRRFWAMAACAAMTSSAWAGELDQPRYAPGDAWVFRDDTEKGQATHQSLDEATIIRTTSDSVLVSIKTVGSAQAPREQMFGKDWSRFRSVNGEETIVNRPLAFPLAIGKTWRVDYTEMNPNPQHLREHFTHNYRVVGWEEVTVPAGTFKALKIESKGVWTADIGARTVSNALVLKNNQNAVVIANKNNIAAKTATGRLYKAFWYVPSVKRWVKSLEEYYSSDGTRNERASSELESFNVGE